jgi:hypothetical protein
VIRFWSCSGAAENSGFIELTGFFQRRKGKPEARVGQARTVKKTGKFAAAQVVPSAVKPYGDVAQGPATP